MEIHIKRVYEQPSEEDGKRILIDRLWPRGLTKEKAKVDLWLKDVAPSTELRQWFNHDVNKWPEFIKRYQKELQKNSIVETLVEEVKKGRMTLLYGARDIEHNDAVVIRNYLK
jgi:uncharacterized protein YeaO (DUF488 family)